MPKKTEMWKCDICGTVYNNGKEATKCEKSHQQDITTFRPKLYYKPKRSYPNVIILNLGCGDSAVYELVRVDESAGGA